MSKTRHNQVRRDGMVELLNSSLGVNRANLDSILRQAYGGIPGCAISHKINDSARETGPTIEAHLSVPPLLSVLH